MNYETRPQGMKSASEEAQQNLYFMKRDERGRVWLWRHGPYAGDYVYCGYDDPEKREEGFGGATLKFALSCGSRIELHGPWHSNSQSLYDAVGVDVRDKHKTFVVVSTGVERLSDMQYNMLDVLHLDENYVEGIFGRGDEIADEFMKTGKYEELYVYQESNSGSMFKRIKKK